jgi:hypothetical protein
MLEVKPGTSLLGVSGTDTPLQGASISGIPTVGEELGHLVSEVGGLHPAKMALSGCARWKLKKTKARASKAGIGGIQQSGNASAPKQGETLTETFNRQRSEGSIPSRTLRPPKKPGDSSEQGNYKEVLTNIKIAIFKETYPEDKLTEHDQESILEELPRVLRGTPIGELPHLEPYRLEVGALYTYIYICANQQSGQWLVRAIDNHKLRSGARLKPIYARNLPKTIKVALRTRDKVAQTQNELLIWNTNLNPGLHTENWRILDKQSDPKGQRLILHIYQDSFVAIKKTVYKMFTGLSQGTVTVLKDPEAQKGGVAPNIAFSKSVSEGEGDRTPTPSDDQRGAADAKEETSSIKSTSADQETPLKGTLSEKKKRVKEEGMETDPSPSK